MLIEAKSITHKYADKIVLRNVDIVVAPNETIGLLGESGSGKSTLGQILTGMLRPTSGTVYFHDTQLNFPFSGTPRRKIQMLYQHPELSFNPRLTLYQSLREIYRLYRLPFSDELLFKATAEYSITPSHLKRFPSQLSGGELQRIALFRILLPEPEIIVLDEPSSMLDVITQAQLMHMLRDIQQKLKLSYLLITHDTHLCEWMSDRIYTIEEGTIFI